jgi:hypothetical protein
MTKASLKDFLRMTAGAVILLVVMLTVLHFQSGQTPAAQLALKAKRIALVEQMRLALASASEAEKSAVMATTDEESQTFADQARTNAAAAELARRQLEGLLEPREPNLFAQFSQAFTDFQRVDKDLLELSVKNTNVKAFNLAFGPAAAAVKEMDTALAGLPTEDVNVLRFADNARIAALRLQALLPPHIAEESDQKEDEMEAQMAKEDRDVRRSLDALSALPSLVDNPGLKTARASYARFSETRAQILKLSRENTNVRSLTISLNQKRKAMFLCQDALAALRDAIEQEPISSAPVNPR